MKHDPGGHEVEQHITRHGIDLDGFAHELLGAAVRGLSRASGQVVLGDLLRRDRDAVKANVHIEVITERLLRCRIDSDTGRIVIAEVINGDLFPLVNAVLEIHRRVVQTRQRREAPERHYLNTERVGSIEEHGDDGVLLRPDLHVIGLVVPKIVAVGADRFFKECGGAECPRCP